MRISTNMLLALAASATLAFALLSDPSPPSVGSFSDAANEGGMASIICQVVASQERENGTTLTLVDSSQGEARAFMSRSLGPPPTVGQIVRLDLAPSDRPGFFFVEGLQYL